MSTKPNIEAMDGQWDFQKDTDFFLCSIAISLKRIADKMNEPPRYGRKSAMDPVEITRMHATMTAAEIAQHLGCNRSTIYRVLNAVAKGEPK